MAGRISSTFQYKVWRLWFALARADRYCEKTMGWLSAMLVLVCTGILHCQQITGERRQWHDIVFTFEGPATSESAEPNPFFHYRLNVAFTKGSKKYVVPGYFAADGNAAETSARAGNRWRAHFVPDETGEWTYAVSFRTGPEVAVSLNLNAGRP